MSDNQSQHSTDKPDRSLVPSDFSLRDIPFMLLAFIVISVASVILGLVRRVFFFVLARLLVGNRDHVLAMAIFRQISRTWSTDTEADVEND